AGMTEVRNSNSSWTNNYNGNQSQHTRPPGFAVGIEDRVAGGNTGTRQFNFVQNNNRRLAFMFTINAHYAMGIEKVESPAPGNQLPLNGATTVTATVRDLIPATNPLSQLVSGVRVKFESSNPAKLQIIGPDEVWTNGLGQATVTVANVDWLPGSATITASIDDADVNVTQDDSKDITFTIGDEIVPDPVAANSTIGASPLSGVHADGSAASTITVTARDGSNAVVPNSLIFLQITSGTGTLSQTWGITGP